jgi:hypothetical protein
MGVKACATYKCESIMCDQMLCGHYICDECIKALKTFNTEGTDAETVYDRFRNGYISINKNTDVEHWVDENLEKDK